MTGNRQTLVRDLIADLVSDIRHGDRQTAEGTNATAKKAYKATCLKQLKELYANRHAVKLNAYGWPKLESFQRQSGDRCKIHASQFSETGSGKGFAGDKSTGGEER